MLRKHWIILLALPLIPTLILGILNLSMVQPPVYETSTTMLVATKAPESPLPEAQVRDIGVLQQHIRNYIELAKSQTIRRKVIKDLNLSVTFEELDKMTYVGQVSNTELLMIKVTNKNPALAAAIANSMAQEFSKTVLLDNISIVDQAEIPIKPNAQSKSRLALSAFLVGLMASLFLVFLMVYLDNTIKTPRDVKDVLGIPCLGLVGNYKMGKQGKKVAPNSLITLEQTKSPISESYR